MYADSFEDADTSHMNHDDLVSAVNGAYNYDAIRSYRDYKKYLDPLADEALRSILRTVVLVRQNKFSNSFVKAFINRSRCKPENISRFAVLAEEEYFNTLNTCTEIYGVKSDNIGIAQAISGVLTLEDATRQIAVSRHHLVMLLTAAGWLDSVDTIELGKSDHGDYLSINEDSFHHYLQTKNTDEYHQKVLAALCSGQKYTRFLEVLEHVNGTTTKPLMSGIL